MPAPTSEKAASAAAVLARRTAQLAGTAAVAGAAVGLYGRFVGLNRFHVRVETLPVLPAGAPDLRILHISDLHTIPGQKLKRDFVQGLAELEPDLVINTGDNFSHPQALPWLLETLDPLLDFPGLYVPGSNCYFAPKLKNPARYLWKSTGDEKKDPSTDRVLPWQQMHRSFEERGWKGVINTTGTLTVNGVRLDLSGVDDPHLGYDQHPGFAPEAFLPDPQQPSVRVGLMHAPYLRTIQRFVDDGAQVMFAGHTHGGQICLPGERALVSNCDLEPSRAKGVSYQDGVPLQVSAGLGTSRFAPVRLNCPPEAVLVTLTAQQPR